MTHGSLFAGIGGFDLAAQWMGWKNVMHCEINPFGQRILNYYWPEAALFSDITKSDFTPYANRIDILSGGFPCQPYSAAGKRKGKADERHLWPQMLRAIREIQPCWVVGENVFGITNWNGGLVFEEVQVDLEAAGTKYGRVYFQLAVQMPPTGETESSLLLTPSTVDIAPGEDRKEKRTAYRASVGRQWSPGSLTEQIFERLMPTPQSVEAYDKSEKVMELIEEGLPLMSRAKGDGSRQFGLKDWILFYGMLPTAASRDYKGARKTGTLEEAGRGASNSLPDFFAQAGKTSQLNPLFVEEMMGFPAGWMELPFQSTGRKA